MTRIMLLPLLLVGCGPDQTINKLEPKLAYSPASIEFGDVAVDYTANFSVEIINAGRASLDVNAIHFSGGNPGIFTVEPSDFRLTMDERQEVIVSFTPKTYLVYADELVIKSDDPDNKEIRIPLTGEGVEAPTPDIEVSDLTLDFGEVTPLTITSMWFTIKNVGDDALTIQQTTQTGSGNFTIVTDPENSVLDPQVDTATVVVLYQPQGLAGDSGSFEILSDDPDEPSVVVHLLGNGGGDFDYPVAVIDGPAEAAPLDTLSLDGSGSYDPEGFALTDYVWTVTGLPSGSNTELSNLLTEDTHLFLDIAGTYEVQLQVWNEIGLASAPAKYEIKAIPDDRIHVELIWDSANGDMDLHVYEDESVQFFELIGDCNYCNPNPNWGGGGSADDPSLDLDDTMGFGPENTNINEPADGNYPVRVHYFEDNNSGASTATVRFYIDGELFDQYSRVLTRNQIWDVGTIKWPDGVVVEENADPYEAEKRTCWIGAN
jgi:hypothetical protein